MLDSIETRPGASNLSRGEQWLGSLTASVAGAQRRAPPLQSHGRSQSLGTPTDASTRTSPTSLPAVPPRSSPMHTAQNPSAGVGARANAVTGDPFDAEWAALATRSPNSTNPFLQNSVVKTFEVRM